MEANFNDAELQDIMNEIENLEREFVEDDAVAAAPEESAPVDTASTESVAEDMIEPNPEPEMVEEVVETAPESEMVEEVVEAVPEPEMVEEVVETAPESEMVEEVVEAVPEPEMVEEVVEAAPESEIVEEVVAPTPEPEMVEEVVTPVEVAAVAEEETIEEIDDVLDQTVEEEVSTPVGPEPTPISDIKESSEAPGGQMHFEGHGQLDFKMNFQLGAQDAAVSVKQGKLHVELDGVQLEINEDGCWVNMAGGVQFNVPFNAQSQKKAA
jgi:hypothetical protein